MAKTDFKTPDEYIATFNGAHAEGLQAIRAAILAAVPGAEEVISYQLPAFRYHGWIFYISAHKDHFSLSCPPPYPSFEAFEAELAGYKKSKSALRIPMNQPLPLGLIGRMAACHVRFNVEAEAKAAAKMGKT